MSAEAFVQWKGTNICMDFTCTCGYAGHVDAEFAYYVKCPACQQVWKSPWYIKFEAVPEAEAHITPVDPS